MRFLAIFLTIALLPVWVALYVLVRLTSPGTFFYKQKRIGKGKKVFTLYKIRTMVYNSEELKEKYLSQNEADGPVFKIKNDPRFTKVGKILAYLAIDELPQLINIIKGEMSFVGPRPLPVDEVQKIPNKYQERFSVLPGITSSWVVRGAHRMRFDEWMKLDLEYIRKQNFRDDIVILLKTIQLVFTLLFKKIFNAK